MQSPLIARIVILLVAVAPYDSSRVSKLALNDSASVINAYTRV